MNHDVKRRRQALHQTHQHYYLNISVEAANLSDWRIESNQIETFSPELECSSLGTISKIETSPCDLQAYIIVHTTVSETA